MQAEIIEQILHLSVIERVEIMEKISRSLREDLRENQKHSADERKAAYLRLRGIAAVEGKTPPTDEEPQESYINYLAVKCK